MMRPAALALGIAVSLSPGLGLADDDPWPGLQADAFDARPMNADSGVVALEAPYRAEDAAIVPMTITLKPAAAPVRKVTVVIDRNPAPVAAVFTLGEKSGVSRISTRFRVNSYTRVHVVAETSDGRLHVTERFVKASGGCSAPPGKDPQAALASLGKIRLRVDGDVVLNQATLAQLMISHPNDSGLAMDQLTRQFTPRRYVRTVNVAYDGQPVLSADLDFSISENPNLRFYFLPRAPGRLTADVVDSNQVAWKSSLDVAPTA